MSNFELELDQVYWVKRDNPPDSYEKMFKEWTLVRVTMKRGTSVYVVKLTGLLHNFQIYGDEKHLFKFVPVLPPDHSHLPFIENVSVDNGGEKSWECHWVTTERVTHPELYKTHNPKVDFRFCASHFLSYQFNAHRFTKQSGSYVVRVKDLATQEVFLVTLTLTKELVFGEERTRREVSYQQVA